MYVCAVQSLCLRYWPEEGLLIRFILLRRSRRRRLLCQGVCFIRLELLRVGSIFYAYIAIQSIWGFPQCQSHWCHCISLGIHFCYYGWSFVFSSDALIFFFSVSSPFLLYLLLPIITLSPPSLSLSLSSSSTYPCLSNCFSLFFSPVCTHSMWSKRMGYWAVTLAHILIGIWMCLSRSWKIYFFSPFKHCLPIRIKMDIAQR